MAINNNAFYVYEELKAAAIEKGAVDEKSLKELLNIMFHELKRTKRSDFLDVLYTSCLHYTYLPKQNKRTYPEIHIKPMSTGTSGTDAMLLIELLAMRLASDKYTDTEEYKTTRDRLFSSFVYKPSAVDRKLRKQFKAMNTMLCQQNALAHFGSDEQKAKYAHMTDAETSYADKAEKVIEAAENTAAETPDEKAARMLDATKKECLAMLAKADAEAAGIIERARKRERILTEETNAQLTRDLNALLASAADTNKQALDLRTSVKETYPVKYAKNLIELYDIIADTLDSSADEGMRKNLISFLDTIEDILAKYGFSAIHTKEGKPFDGKIHEADSTSFDPKSAVIAKSRRCGFSNGEAVIRKESVSVKKK